MHKALFSTGFIINPLLINEDQWHDFSNILVASLTGTI